MSGDVLVVLNPASGGGRAVNKWVRLRRRLEDRGVTYRLWVSPYAGAISEILPDILPMFDRVVMLGGDGTISEVLTAWYIAGMPDIHLLIVPAGTGNDFVKSLPRNRYVSFQPGWVRVDGKVILWANMVGSGIDAATTRFASEVKGKVSGLAAYGYGLIKAFATGSTKLEVKFSTLGYSGSASLLLFARGRYVGGGFYLAPHADPLRADIPWLILEPVSFWDLIVSGKRLFDGTILTHPLAHHGVSSEPVGIELNGSAAMNIDGEYYGCVQKFSVGVLDRPISVGWFDV